MAVFLAVASTQTLTMMAANRYFQIVKPAKYRRYFTRNKSTIMILVSWMCAMCYPLPNTLSGHKMVFNPSKFICYAENDSVVFLVSASVNVGLAICLIFYCYVRIIKTVRTHNHNFQNTGNLTNFPRFSSSSC